jgi:TetR/AcrR family transcriptional regulator, cholesterol catabolism regulator
MKHADETHMKDRMLEEGIRLFLQKGFRGTTVEDITDAVNITKGAFYWHFTSKNELLKSVIEQYEHLFVDEIIGAVSDLPGDFQRKFNYYHKYVTEFAFRNRNLCVGFMTLSAELAGSGVDIEGQIMTIYAKYRAFLKSLVEMGQKDGFVRSGLNSDIAAHAIIAINNGMLLEWYMNQTDIDSQLLAKTYREIILRGILTARNYSDATNRTKEDL